MPVSPALASGLAKETLGIYTTAEELLLERIAKRLGQGLDAPAWAERKLLEVQALRTEAQDVIARLDVVGVDAVEDAVRIGYNRGVASAGGDLLDGGASAAGSFGRINERAVGALVDRAQRRVRSSHLRILRGTEDIYRSVITDVSAQTVTGVLTRKQAAGLAMDRFAKAGVTGFVDTSGRSWSMKSYVAMATRTAAAQAAVQGHVDRLREAGHDLVIVSNSPKECEICRPWEGKVLSLSKALSASSVTAEDLREGGMVTVAIAGTLSEATRSGLFHPNCTHSVSLFQPGLTQVDPSQKVAPAVADPGPSVADRERAAAAERARRAAQAERATTARKELERAAAAPAQAAVPQLSLSSLARRLPAAPAPVRVAVAPPKPVATTATRLTATQHDAMTPKPGRFDKARRDAALVALKQTEDGRLLADSLRRFQRGGAAVTTLRKNIAKRARGEALDEVPAKRADAVINAIREFPTDRIPEVLYRGMKVAGADLERFNAYRPGDRIDLGLSSFSSDRSVARKFQSVGAGEKVTIELVAGPERRALPVEEVSVDAYFFSEREWLSGGAFRVVSRRKTAAGTLIRVEQLESL